MVNPVGLRLATDVGLPQNPASMHTTRDFSSTRRSVQEYRDIFLIKDDVAATPWVTEYEHNQSDPREYEARIASMSLVHTQGNTHMARAMHHTFNRPKFPPGTVDIGRFTTSSYSPDLDPATHELHEVCRSLHPLLDPLLEALRSYQLSCPRDGWISTAGFVACASKAGIGLSRSEFLAIERSVPKDNMGRINYLQVAALVQHIVDQTGGGAAGEDAAAAE